MNKNRGAAIGAVVLAGLFLRPVGTFSAPQSESLKGGTNLLTTSSPVEAQGEGPWIASCKYWAPARAADEYPSAESQSQPDEVQDTLNESNSGIDWHLHATTRDKDLGCRGEGFQRWGFPKDTSSINVKAIIATVPDPVHSHLALAFDRTVDALLQAAVDNNYVSSYYWLPWKSRVSALKAAESSGDSDPGHDPEREGKPGLIILKYVPPEEETDSSRSFYQVIYVFLVAETPTQGIDGFQLQKAFGYENDLDQGLKKPGNHFSRGQGNHTAIIGPIYSGSAASLKVGVDTETKKKQRVSTTQFDITGATATSLAENRLNAKAPFNNPQIHYLSFDQDGDYDERAFLNHLSSSGYDLRRVALLTEENTVLGNAVSSGRRADKFDQILKIRFPREISLLRNAQVAEQGSNQAVPVGSPTPYLHLSLKDSSAGDSVPQFDRENTPLSQEAQLMTIARQLHRYRSQFIAIAASNPLDQIFLAQFLHRACPDARLVFFGGDLLMEREIDNVPYIGTVTVTPYNLVGLGQSPPQPSPTSPLPTASHVYPDSGGEAYYNAASFTLWALNPQKRKPHLRGYQNDDISHAALWATAIGTDGYYPLAILSSCASDSTETLPTIDESGTPIVQACRTLIDTKRISTYMSNLRNVTIYPSLIWVALCTLVSLLCLFHVVILWVADYWSPFTRDLAIQDNDQPRRRSMYVHVGMAMLFSMAFVLAYPVMWLSHVAQTNPHSLVAGACTLGCGFVAVVATFWKTWRHIWWVKTPIDPSHDQGGLERAWHRISANIFSLINFLAWTALIGLPVLWALLCSCEWVAGQHSYVGLMFSYRCINPGSGVSPVVPVLLLLFSWYLWAFFQTWRLRFSEGGRPWLPGRLDDLSSNRLFVSDQDLRECQNPRDVCLYKNITCLFISRQVMRRFQKLPRTLVDLGLVIIYGGLLIYFSFFTPIRSLDHFLWGNPYLPNGRYLSSPYEFLVGVLFFPLIIIALAGWIRMILIWGALKRGLLERLENQPIRFAFSRLKGMGWMTMLRQGGLHEQWRDMARSVESIRQMLHQSDLEKSLAQSEWQDLENANVSLLATIGQLTSRIRRPSSRSNWGVYDYDFMKEIELHFATFSEMLLMHVLIPYWQNERTGLVDSGEVEELPGKASRWQMRAQLLHLPIDLHAAPASAEPSRIMLAEEFLAIRYVSLIRAVLANMRYLMSFVSTSFVLAIIAWNSYPFQPRQQVDWLFTGLLFFLGSGIVWVFAQMYRNPILSRVTETKANELGVDFYIRILSFGAVPLFTWLAYQFPDIGAVIFKFLQPGIDVLK
jgi:hypothetical protein